MKVTEILYDCCELITEENTILFEYFTKKGMTVGQAFNEVFYDMNEEKSYVVDELGFKVGKDLDQIKAQINVLRKKFKPVWTKKIQNDDFIDTVEGNTFYLETTDAYDDEDDYKQYVLGGLRKMIRIWSETDVNEPLRMTEAAIRQFKRFGSVVKKQYRCLSGPKKGKIVASPQACAQRKDPKKIRHGRKVARMKKGVRVRKTIVSKRKQISKMVTRMNKKLAGKTK